MKLSEMELAALRIAAESPLVSSIPEKTVRDAFDSPVPGLRIYSKLVARGLIFFTEEPLICEDEPAMGTWTQTVYLTDEGNTVLEQANAGERVRWPQ